jgi:hypothetical protein
LGLPSKDGVRPTDSKTKGDNARLSLLWESFPQILVAFGGPGVEKKRTEAHIRPMEKYRSGMLEISVTYHPPRWEWEVTSNGETIANGFEDEHVKAKFEGYNALFHLLAAGWSS